MICAVYALFAERPLKGTGTVCLQLIRFGRNLTRTVLTRSTK